VSGTIFGLGVWVFMYYGVLPLTFGRPNVLPAWPLLLNQLGIHAFGVGLPIALLAWRSGRAGYVASFGPMPATTGGSSRKTSASLR
jgi:hypothetical protein